MNDEGSITQWIQQLKSGDDSIAEQELWNRYFRRLVLLAREKLRGAPTQAEDEEDAALSAMDSFFRGVQRGRFPDIHDRTHLWPLLLTITANKAINQIHRQRAQKRGGGRVVNEQDRSTAIEAIMSTEPSPEFAVQIAEECQSRVEALSDDSLRTVAQLKLEGYTNREIAAQLEVVERTVERKLRQIRQRWSDATES